MLLSSAWISAVASALLICLVGALFLAHFPWMDD